LYVIAVGQCSSTVTIVRDSGRTVQ